MKTSIKDTGMAVETTTATAGFNDLITRVRFTTYSTIGLNDSITGGITIKKINWKTSRTTVKEAPTATEAVCNVVFRKKERDTIVIISEYSEVPVA